MSIKYLITAVALIVVASAANANDYPINQQAYNAAAARQQYQYGNAPVVNPHVSMNTPGAQANFNGPGGSVYYTVPKQSPNQPQFVNPPQQERANPSYYTPPPQPAKTPVYSAPSAMVGGPVHAPAKR
jgi:hypothetical protein